MESDFNCYLDSDFIETITENKFDYLKGIIKGSEEILHLEAKLNQPNSVLILIFEKAINSTDYQFKSTNKIDYYGAFINNLN